MLKYIEDIIEQPIFEEIEEAIEKPKKVGISKVTSIDVDDFEITERELPVLILDEDGFKL